MISEEDIPDHWEVALIEEVVKKAKNGGTPRRSTEEYWEGDIPWLSSGEVRGKYATDAPDEYITKKGLEESSAYLWPKKTVLVAMYGRGTIGRPAITAIETTGNQAICGLMPDEEKINHEFLYYWLENIRDYMANKGRGATASRQNLNRGLILDTKVPLPPLEEQEYIVSEIEDKLNKANSLTNSVKRIRELVNEYEESLLAFSFAGRQDLSSKGPDRIPTESDIPNHWEIKTLSEIGKRRSSMTEPESGKKYCLYSFKAVDDGSGYHIQDGGEIDSRKRELQGGEVLISRLNPRINRVQRVSDEHEYTPIASSEFVVIEQSEIDSEYLYHYLKSPYIYHRLTNHVTGSTGSRSRVGFDFVMDSPIPVPPSDEQRRIVEQVESVDMNRVHRAVEDVVDLFGEYRDSVLSYAFKKSPINKGKLSDGRVMTAEKSISE